MGVALRVRHAVGGGHVEAVEASRADVAAVELAVGQRSGTHEVPRLVGTGAGRGEQDPTQGDPGDERDER